MKDTSSHSRHPALWIDTVDFLGILAAVGIAVGSRLPWARSVEWSRIALESVAALPITSGGSRLALWIGLIAALLILSLLFGLVRSDLVRPIRLLVAVAGFVCLTASFYDALRMYQNSPPYRIAPYLRAHPSIGWYVTVVSAAVLVATMVVAVISAQRVEHHERRRRTRREWIVRYAKAFVPGADSTAP